MAWVSPIYYYPAVKSWYTFHENGAAATAYHYSPVPPYDAIVPLGGFFGNLSKFMSATPGLFIRVAAIGRIVPDQLAVDEGQ